MENANNTIAVFGMGHIGLPTALGFAEWGHRVIGVDCDSERIAALKSGSPPFYEPGLEELLLKHLGNPNFCLSDDVAAAIRSADVLFLCVWTPQRPSGAADLRAIEDLARLIGQNLNGYKLVVEKSTVPALTGQWLHRTIARHAHLQSPNGGNHLPANGKGEHKGNGKGKSNGNGNGNGNGIGSRQTAPRNGDHKTNGGYGRAEEPAELPLSHWFDVAANPEFLQEGRALDNLFAPDRVVCGVTSERAKRILTDLYRPLNCPVLFTSLATAEVIKHAANAFLATKISFINLVADICEAVGADVTQVATGIGLDPRIGTRFLQAGIGFGGYCFPKDLKAFVHLAEEHNVDVSLLRQTEAINLGRVERLVQKVRQGLWILEGKTVAVLGLAFKAGTDDVRESPSLKVVAALQREGVRLRLCDPFAVENAKRVLPENPESVTYCASPYDAARGAHALLILNEAPEFSHLKLSRLRQLMQLPLIVDGRNLLDPDEVRRAGFEYLSIGRGTRASRSWVGNLLDSPGATPAGLDTDCMERVRERLPRIERAPLRH